MTRSIILLSGGLDSLVSLGLTKERLNIELALTFDYGQKSAKQEIEASKNICEYYGIEHEIIKLEWLEKITKTSLVSDKEIPNFKNSDAGSDTAKQVWVPNRNGMFLNVAGCFADANDFDYIVIGANKEEGLVFPDNTQEFIDAVNEEFKYSTQNNPRVAAPLINFDKNAIVKHALDNSIPLDYVRSCYRGTDKHCGLCESCVRLKNALENNNDGYYIKLLF